MDIHGAVSVEFKQAAVAEADVPTLTLAGTQLGHHCLARGTFTHGPAGGTDGHEHGQGLEHGAPTRTNPGQGRQGNVGRQVAQLSLQLLYPGPGLGVGLVLA
ncbi:hypothetical protein D9M71_743370 [compost metagenome]